MMKKYLLTAGICISCIIFIMLVSIACVLQYYSNSRIDDEILNSSSSCDQTRFFYYDFSDRNRMIGNCKEISGAVLENGIKHEYVGYNEIPTNLINAFVAIEDKRFYTHHGIDYIRTSRAIANYVFQGRSSFGGSTITQQLVKNITGNDAVMIDRKLREAFCALDLERKADKSEIIEMYLNVINLANGCRGVGSASRYYFSKSVSELDLCECACIAAITNNPSKYDPQKNPTENKKRLLLVLSCMYDGGYINKSEYEKALSQKIRINTPNGKCININSWYIDEVIKDVTNDLSKKYGISRQTASALLYRGGYKIYTAMNLEIQNILDDFFADKNNFPIESDDIAPQSSMIIIDPHSGDILGIAGANGEKRGNRIQNFATDTKRPPGSCIKPLSVYTPAFEMGIINWSSIIEDSPIINDQGSNKPWPSNHNNIYMGDVNVKYAVANSVNTVAVKLLKRIGNRSSYDFINRLKINSLNEKDDLGDASLALGQPSHGITLKELTAAYSIFNCGIMSTPRTYYKVTDTDGKIILDNSNEQTQIISYETASIMTKLLQCVIKEGTAKGISLADRIEVAGKTGTTQFNHDKYFVGYTPSLLAGVWFGYEYPRSLDKIKGNYSVYIWDTVMEKIYNETSYRHEKKRFDISPNVQELSYNKITGKILNIMHEKINSENIENGWFDVRDAHFEE